MESVANPQFKMKSNIPSESKPLYSEKGSLQENPTTHHIHKKEYKRTHKSESSKEKSRGKPKSIPSEPLVNVNALDDCRKCNCSAKLENPSVDYCPKCGHVHKR